MIGARLTEADISLTKRVGRGSFTAGIRRLLERQMRYDDWKSDNGAEIEMDEHAVTDLADEASGALLEACNRWLDGDADDEDEVTIADALADAQIPW
jgi:hypothetical protein